jgi:hypothetical protein
MPGNLKNGSKKVKWFFFPFDYLSKPKEKPFNLILFSSKILPEVFYSDSNILDE